MQIELKNKIAIVTIGGESREFITQLSPYGTPEFQNPPCAIVQTSADQSPALARLMICRNYKAPLSIGAIVNHKLHRDIICARWPNPEDYPSA